MFGEGPADAHLMLVGEQPGDQEDLAGRPFVGPAGKVLDAALEAAGIVRSDVYITNAVKHFKNEPRGKRRIHKKPDTREIDLCRFWLDNEMEIVRPRVVVALGATAARGLMRRRHDHQCQSRPAHRPCPAAVKPSSPCIRLICCDCRKSATSGVSSTFWSRICAWPARRRAPSPSVIPYTCACEISATMIEAPI